MSGPFKMKSAAHGGPMRRNFPSAFPKLDILLDGESIGSGSDKRSSEEARLKAEQQSKLNTYIEDKNTDAANASVGDVSTEDWNENKDNVQFKHDEKLKKDVTTKSGKVLEHKKVEYTGQDKIDYDNKQKEIAKAKKDAEVAAYYEKQKKKNN